MSIPHVLAKILKQTRQDVEERKRDLPAAQLMQQITDQPARYSLAYALAGGELAFIAEIKKASPSEGVIRAQFDPSAIARSYAEAGANALSILTDEPFFQGSLAYLRQVRPLVTIPILRKDFIVDAYQLLEAKAAGADAVLLIVAALEPTELRRLLQETYRLGLEALVETHTRDEMEIAVDLGTPIIGINNRNLDTLAIDLATTEQLAELAPDQTILVGESGLHTGDDLRRMRDAEVDAVLVGTHFMKHPDPGQALRAFKAQLATERRPAEASLPCRGTHA